MRKFKKLLDEIKELEGTVKLLIDDKNYCGHEIDVLVEDNTMLKNIVKYGDGIHLDTMKHPEYNKDLNVLFFNDVEQFTSRKVILNDLRPDYSVDMYRKIEPYKYRFYGKYHSQYLDYEYSSSDESVDMVEINIELDVGNKKGTNKVEYNYYFMNEDELDAIKAKATTLK